MGRGFLFIDDTLSYVSLTCAVVVDFWFVFVDTMAVKIGEG